MGRALDKTEIDRLAELTSLDLALEKIGDDAQGPDFALARARLSTTAPLFVQPLDGERIAGYALLSDIEGRPLAILRASLARSVHKQGLTSLGYILFSPRRRGPRLLGPRLRGLRSPRPKSPIAPGGRHQADRRLARPSGARVASTGRDELSALAEAINLALSEIETADSQLKDSLAEKELLLREVHHRVKNNLQVVSSLLSLQSSATQDEDARDALLLSRARIYSMALIHELLYREDGGGGLDLARVDFHDYLHDLAAYLFDAFRADPAFIKVEVKGDAIQLDADTAINCGLVVNELISNSLKHAFPEGRPGRISIETREEGAGRISIAVSDDGIGFPPNFDFTKATSMGWQLVSTLARQLNAKIAINGLAGMGASVSLSFSRKPSS